MGSRGRPDERKTRLLLFLLQVFKMKAVQLAEKLLPAFNTPTGIPWAIVNLKRSVTPG